MQNSLVIPGRTRYPSSAVQTTDSSRYIDLDVTSRLLNIDGQASSRHTSSHSSIQSSDSVQRDTTSFVRKYNELAKQHGLSTLGAFAELVSSQRPVTDTQSKKAPKKNLWRRLVRSDTSTDPNDTTPLVRKSSINSLLGRDTKLSLKCQSLDEFYQFGGVSVMRLPPKYRAVHLAIPTCLAATANFLIENGQHAPGIFRIPGQTNVVNSIYNYYLGQIHEMEKTKDQIHISVGSSALPIELRGNTHDVASAFKKFLWDLPGGVLGSVPLFKALHDIATHPRAAQEQPQLCALAVLSLKSARRIAIVCSLFGLLALLKRDPPSLDDRIVSPSRLLAPESMSSRALGLVFAPVLLGALTDQIETRCDLVTPAQDDHTGQGTPRRGFWRTPKHRKSASADKTPEIANCLERTSAAAAIIEMMLQVWEDIASHIRSLDHCLSAERRSTSRILVGSQSTNMSSKLNSSDVDSVSQPSLSQRIMKRPIRTSSQPFLKIPCIMPGSHSEDEGGVEELLPHVRVHEERFTALLTASNEVVPTTGPQAPDTQGTSPWWDRKLMGALRLKSKDPQRSSFPGSSDPKVDVSITTEEEVRALDLKNSGSDISNKISSSRSASSTHLSAEHDCSRQTRDEELSKANKDASKAVYSVSQGQGIFSGTSNCPGSPASVIVRRASLTPEDRRDLRSSSYDVSTRCTSIPTAEDSETLQWRVISPKLITIANGAEQRPTPESDAGADECRANRAGTGNLHQYEADPMKSAAHLHPQHAERLRISRAQPQMSSCKRSQRLSQDGRLQHTPASAPQPKMKQGTQALSSTDLSASAPTRPSPTRLPKPARYQGRNRNSDLESPPGTFYLQRHRARATHRPQSKRLDASPSAIRVQSKEHETLPVRTKYPSAQSRISSRESQESSTAVSAIIDQQRRFRPIARRLEFHPSQSRFDSSVSNKETAEVGFWKRQQRDQQYMANVGTLYAEVRVLNETLAMVRRDRDDWKARAQWAERQLLARRRLS